MNIPDMEIEVVCLFCGSTLTHEEGEELSPDKVIKCSACGEENDYESVVEVAQEKGVKQMEAAIQNELDKLFK